jgi:hypothetical protein
MKLLRRFSSLVVAAALLASAQAQLAPLGGARGVVHTFTQKPAPSVSASIEERNNHARRRSIDVCGSAPKGGL